MFPYVIIGVLGLIMGGWWLFGVGGPLDHWFDGDPGDEPFGGEIR